MLIFSGLLLIPRPMGRQSNSPFPKKKEAIERYHNHTTIEVARFLSVIITCLMA
jgi:hypothetical protein